jgi:hypothetical protein
MPITQRHIDELKTIYQKQSGEELSNKEAWDMTIRLVNLFRILLKDQSGPESAEKVRTL